MTHLIRRTAGLWAIAALAIAGAAAGPAAGAGGNPIINDCEANGQLTQDYPLGRLQYALSHLPASIKQYGDCYDVIQEAIIRKGRGRLVGTAQGGGGSFLPTPVIIVLAVLVLAALGFTGMALRARRGPAADEDEPSEASGAA